MTPAAYERLQTRIPLAAVAIASWATIVAGSEQRKLGAFCSTDFWIELSFDKLAFAVTFYSPANLVGEWLLMVAAMMMPMLVGAVGHIRARSLPSRRLRALVLLMIGYWTIWFAYGFLIVTTMLAFRVMQTAPIVTVALVGAVVLFWQFSPAKQFCLNRCHSQPSLAVHGISADLDALRYGVMQGIWCCGTCWALMLIPLAMQSGHLIAMAATSALLTAERLEKPRRPGWEIRWPSTIFRLVRFRLNVWRSICRYKEID
ncbi:DUF2182 domain-containing protein [Mesorhizobium sp. M0496]|uniref:DUF2182 domain-containing protein n=1 Tax=Mesorhizobium sp. M0496 TaxID=2956952 RepID=UPI0033392A79